MIKIGCHLSSSKGFENMAKECNFLGATAFQYFSRNPRGSKAKKIDKQDLEKFFKIHEKVNFSIIAHAPYTLNLCSKNEDIRFYSQKILKEDLEITNLLPNIFYNFHPGSHTGQGTEIGINQVSSALNHILQENQQTIVLLETMAGKGSEVGKNFKEISEIIDKINLKEKVGVCLDTCHIFDGGYDIVNHLNDVIEEFEKFIGISKLKVIHLNDSKNLLGSKKDRHEQIGRGNIGMEAISNIINNKNFKNLPFILETPQENLQGYKDEIKLLKSYYKE